MTVSRVITGKKHVSAEMARRVEEAVARLNYQPNEAARTLKRRMSRMIGLIVPSLSDPFFSQCAHAAQQVATGQGRQTTRILLPTGLVVRPSGGCEPMARIQNHG